MRTQVRAPEHNTNQKAKHGGCACNPRAGRAEAGGFLRLTVYQPRGKGWCAPGSVRNPVSGIKVDINREGHIASTSTLFTVYTHVHTPRTCRHTQTRYTKVLEVKKCLKTSLYSSAKTILEFIC